MSSGATATLAAGTAISAMAWAVRGRSSSVFAPSVWRARPGRNSIALTFDDGPCRSTPKLLKLLEQHHARATFFQVGANVARFPEISRDVLAHGHEIGNHSRTHPNFALRSPGFITAEFSGAQRIITEATDREPSLLRAPFGVRWFGFRSMQQRLGLTGVMWSIIGLDWKLPAAAIVNRVASRVRDGDIICLHDGRGTLKDPDVGPTLEAVGRLLPILTAKGYHFETVTQLLCPLK